MDERKQPHDSEAFGQSSDQDAIDQVLLDAIQDEAEVVSPEIGSRCDRRGGSWLKC